MEGSFIYPNHTQMPNLRSTSDQSFSSDYLAFIPVLAAKLPNLSRMELKISALLIHGLATKEMSEILSVSVDAISKHRLSIRRKLGLTHDEALQGHLAKHLNDFNGKHLDT